MITLKIDFHFRNPNRRKRQPRLLVLSLLSRSFYRFMSQLCYGPVVIYYMVYHYTKRAMLVRLLANKGPAIYVVYLNRYFVIPP